MKDWNIRRYKFGDEWEIIRLFQEVFGKPMGKTESLKHWNWEYKNNPNNQLEIILALDGKRIVSHYAVIPIRMIIRDKEFLTSLSLDTMTHREYRGEGLFPTLASKLYETLGKKGIPITYGFPNAFSIRGFVNNLDWFVISDLPIYFRPMDFTVLFYRFLKLQLISKIIGSVINIFFNLFLKKKKFSKNIKIERIKEFSKDFDRLWEANKKKIPLGVVRDSKYLNWRYFQKPEEEYIIFSLKHNNRLKGYIILKIEERYDLRIGLIIDILTDSSFKAYLDYLINHALIYFQKEKVGVVSIIMFPQWDANKLLKKNLFIKIFRIFFTEEIYFGARINSKDFDGELVKDPNNWYLTWGDIDVV